MVVYVAIQPWPPGIKVRELFNDHYWTDLHMTFDWSSLPSTHPPDSPWLDSPTQHNDAWQSVSFKLMTVGYPLDTNCWVVDQANQLYRIKVASAEGSLLRSSGSPTFPHSGTRSPLLGSSSGSRLNELAYARRLALRWQAQSIPSTASINHEISFIGAGEDGSFWMVCDGVVYRRCQQQQQAAEPQIRSCDVADWEQMPPLPSHAAIRGLSVFSASVAWILDDKGQAFEWHAYNTRWHDAVGIGDGGGDANGSDDIRFAINQDNEVPVAPLSFATSSSNLVMFSLSGSNLLESSSPIACGDEQQRAKPVTTCNSGFWRQDLGAPALTFISVGAEHEVWGIGANNAVYRRRSDIVPLGPPHLPPQSRISHRRAPWVQVHGVALKFLSVGNHCEVWGINTEGVVYVWSNEQECSKLDVLDFVDLAPQGVIALPADSSTINSSSTTTTTTTNGTAVLSLSWHCLGNTTPLSSLSVNSSGVAWGSDKSHIYRLSRHRLLVKQSFSMTKLWDDRGTGCAPYNIGYACVG
jgi:hypothetical protein